MIDVGTVYAQLTHLKGVSLGDNLDMHDVADAIADTLINFLDDGPIEANEDSVVNVVRTVTEQLCEWE